MKDPINLEHCVETVPTEENSFTALLRIADREAEVKKKNPEQGVPLRSVTMSQLPQFPPKPKTIDFTVKDSDDNIMFMNGSEKKVVKAATFSKLIERLACTSEHLDPEDFLFSYRLFAEPREVITALVERCKTQEKGIKLRIFNIFKRWVEKFWYDFSREQKNVTLVFNFIDPIINSNNNNDIPMAKMVRTKIEQKQKESYVALEDDDLCVPSEWAEAAEEAVKPQEVGPILGIFEHTSEEIAAHITLIEWEMWTKIRETELIGLGWTKKDKDQLSPNVCNMTKRFNVVSDWVATCICSEENVKKRTRLIRKFIDIADALRTLGNYNGVLEIFSALRRGPVARLLKSFGALDSHSQKIYENLSELTDSAKNYAALRVAVAHIDPPVIPYLGMYLTDILFAIEGNPTHLCGLINFYRCRLYSENIKKIKQYQLKGFEIREKNLLIPHLYDHLLNLYPSWSEDDLYTVSSFIEPREGKEQSPRPDALIDSYVEQTKLAHGVLNDKADRKAEKKREGNRERTSEKESKKADRDFKNVRAESDGALRRKNSLLSQSRHSQERLVEGSSEKKKDLESRRKGSFTHSQETLSHVSISNSFGKKRMPLSSNNLTSAETSRGDSSRGRADSAAPDISTETTTTKEEKVETSSQSEVTLLSIQIDSQNRQITSQNKQIELLAEQNKYLMESDSYLRAQIDRLTDGQNKMLTIQNDLLKQIQNITYVLHPNNPRPPTILATNKPEEHESPYQHLQQLRPQQKQQQQPQPQQLHLPHLPQAPRNPYAHNNRHPRKNSNNINSVDNLATTSVEEEAFSRVLLRVST